MNIIIYYFNYDLTNKVILSMICPAGYYSKAIIEDHGVEEEHWYYHGVDNDGLQTKKDLVWLDEFVLASNMSVFKY